MFLLRPLIFLTLMTLAGFISCKKDQIDQRQGSNYNLLLKTVTKNNFNNAEWTEDFSYNNNNQLTATSVTYSNPPIGTEQQTETFYRNNTGKLDSSLSVLGVSGPTSISKTFFTYDGSGKLIKSTQNNVSINQYSDSSLYVYSGTVLQERNDYRSLNGGPFSLLRRVFYEFDGSGNLIQAIFQWPLNNITDTARIEYDARINPMPLDRLLFYWAPFFYNDYKPFNNPTVLFSDGVESFNNEYTYTQNNKPLYRKSKVIGSANSFYETWYYYD